MDICSISWRVGVGDEAAVVPNGVMLSSSARSKARRRASDFETPQRFVSRSQRATVAGSKATVVRIVMVAIMP